MEDLNRTYRQMAFKTSVPDPTILFGPRKCILDLTLGDNYVTGLQKVAIFIPYIYHMLIQYFVRRPHFSDFRIYALNLGQLTKTNPQSFLIACGNHRTFVFSPCDQLILLISKTLTFTTTIER